METQYKDGKEAQAFSNFSLQSEIKNNLIEEAVDEPAYVIAIKEATAFLPNMNVSKKNCEDGLLAIEAKVRTLTDENEGVKNVSKVLFVAGTRLGVPGKDFFSFIQFMPDLISKMPSASEQGAQDKAIIKKLEDLRALMNLIKSCFENLKKEFERELKSLRGKPAFNSFKDFLEGHSEFYKNNSYYITTASDLYDELLEQATVRVNEDCDKKEIVEKKTEYSTISKIFKMKLEDFQKIVVEYHKNTEIIEKLPEDLKALKILMDKAVNQFRLKFNFFSEHCAKRFYPDESWGYLAYKKAFYASAATFSSSSYFSPTSYIDNPLKFDRDDYLLPLNANDYSGGENYIVKSEEIDFNNLKQKMNRSSSDKDSNGNNTSESLEEDYIGYQNSTQPVQIPNGGTPVLNLVLSVNVGSPGEFTNEVDSLILDKSMLSENHKFDKKEDSSNSGTTELIPVIEFSVDQDVKK